ncbi:type II toxin-antitoxin system RelE/ParE family toxin [Ramlibacter sp. 2FC]|uniref:type II toxin-antitoxin system RelE/ParE family toxin n=1 Tax=Ramlibacter sp. 2FC TaxID=2502188 RepID=UPI00201D9D88|nr:type II toxin-antitoxin system RelE/ParE family toxin [Ramlibacter sp. 2FC]
MARGRSRRLRPPGRTSCGAWAKLRLPHSRAFGDGLFELRPRGRSGIGRAFYCFLVGKRVVVLHAFIKKSQQTPDRELKLARKRMKEVSDV